MVGIIQIGSVHLTSSLFSSALLISVQPNTLDSSRLRTIFNSTKSYVMIVGILNSIRLGSPRLEVLLCHSVPSDSTQNA